MGLRIATNVSAINAQRNLSYTQRLIEKSSAQLSSGFRINKAADDAAGLAISENMKAQLRSSAQAKRNANDGISLAQTAEGALGELTNIMTRVRELAIQAATDTLGDDERTIIDTEVQQLKKEIERTAQSTGWNDTKLLNGSNNIFDFQIGTYNTDNDVISYNAGENVATLEAFGMTEMNFKTKESARESIGLLDESMQKVSSMRASLGALQSRLTSTVDILAITEENIAAANSRIRDTDVAAASSDMAKNAVLLQAGTAAIGQANQNNQLALKLLG